MTNQTKDKLQARQHAKQSHNPSKTKAVDKTYNKQSKGIGDVVIIGILVTLAVIGGFIAILAVASSKTQEDWTSSKYDDDFEWFTGLCFEAVSDILQSGSLLYCTCGYFGIREDYGDIKLYKDYNVLSYILKDPLASRVMACYKKELQDYKTQHPDVDLDEMWNNGQRIIVP